jgi:hypothetical protein
MAKQKVYIVISMDSYDTEKLFEIQGCFINKKDAQYLKKHLSKLKLFKLVCIEEHELTKEG